MHMITGYYAYEQGKKGGFEAILDTMVSMAIRGVIICIMSDAGTSKRGV
jgi:hypothetical protein